MPDHRKPVVAQPDLNRAVGAVDAEGVGRAGAEDHGWEVFGSSVEEPAGFHAPLEGRQKGGLGGVDRDRVGIGRRDPIAPVDVHVGVDVADGGSTQDGPMRRTIAVDCLGRVGFRPEND